jgi:Rad3-related DNA helicase
MRFEDILDGTGKEPRQIQLDYFRHLEQALGSHTRHVMDAPPGIGKSFIARTIQRTLGDTAIVTPANILVDQYCEIYKELNGLKGKEWYETRAHYMAAKAKAAHTETVFNPISFYYYHLNTGTPKPANIIVDEAHKLGDMLLLVIGQSLSCDYYGIPDGLDAKGFLGWLEAKVKKLAPFHNRTGKAEGLSSLYETLNLKYQYLKDHLSTVETRYEMLETKQRVKKKHITIRPIQVPHGLIHTIFGDARMLLFSGSITRLHTDELFPGKDVDFVQYEPLAPKENRPLFYSPIPKPQRADIKTIAHRIRDTFEKEGRVNTMVHVTYSMQNDLALELKGLPIHTHNKETKAEVLQNFKEQGGILLASGMAEGVDLPGDLCRSIIVPKLPYANRGDPAVIKRLALPNGNEWYSVDTVMTLIQQLGRGVRGADDSCNLHIWDYTFPRLVSRTRKYLTKGFLEAIKWEGK